MEKPMNEEEVLAHLKSSFALPTGIEIIGNALQELLGKNIDNIEYIKCNFSFLIEQVQIDAYEKYLKYERPAAIKSFRMTFESMLGDNPSKNDFFDILHNNFWALDKFFLGLTQGRRPRAGKAFEHAIKVLFNKLGYPYTPQPIINGQPDFLLPSKEHYENNAMDCIIFTVKRTLRERWRQITTEGTRGYQFFLATIDTSVSDRDIGEMLRSRIYLVVPINLKNSVYLSHSNVISFEVFFEQHLDPAMERWRSNNVIE